MVTTFFGLGGVWSTIIWLFGALQSSIPFSIYFLLVFFLAYLNFYHLCCHLLQAQNCLDLKQLDFSFMCCNISCLLFPFIFIFLLRCWVLGCKFLQQL
jgi:hypothetical protein